MHLSLRRDYVIEKRSPWFGLMSNDQKLLECERFSVQQSEKLPNFDVYKCVDRIERLEGLR